jgi:hypothetical protein
MTDVLDRLVRYAQFYGSVEFLVERQKEGLLPAGAVCDRIRELVIKLDADLRLSADGEPI